MKKLLFFILLDKNLNFLNSNLVRQKEDKKKY